MQQPLEFQNEPHTDFIFQIVGNPWPLVVLALLVAGLAVLAVRWVRRQRRRV